jgi:hypothetical protein
MNRHFWLDDEQWAIIEPLLQQVHTGPERVDDRRISAVFCTVSAWAARGGQPRRSGDPILCRSSASRKRLTAPPTEQGDGACAISRTDREQCGQLMRYKPRTTNALSTLGLRAACPPGNAPVSYPNGMVRTRGADWKLRFCLGNATRPHWAADQIETHVGRTSERLRRRRRNPGVSGDRQLSHYQRLRPS